MLNTQFKNNVHIFQFHSLYFIAFQSQPEEDKSMCRNIFLITCLLVVIKILFYIIKNRREIKNNIFIFFNGSPTIVTGT